MYSLFFLTCYLKNPTIAAIGILKLVTPAVHATVSNRIVSDLDYQRENTE